MDFLSVGVNFALAVIGAVVGVYFLTRAGMARRVLDPLSMTLFIAIGCGALVSASTRVWVLPFYFGRAIGRQDIQELMLDHPVGLIVLLAISAWMFMLHLKPVFHRVSFSQWVVATLAGVIILTGLGTAGAQLLALFI